MKRIIYISEKNFAIEEKLSLAKELSKKTQLPITMGECGVDESDDIFIASIPEIIKCSFDKKVKKNYIHNLDFTNEYVKFTKNTFCIFKTDDITLTVKPKIVERHLVKFRTRFEVTGLYTFNIINDNSIIHIQDNKFEVI